MPVALYLNVFFLQEIIQIFENNKQLARCPESMVSDVDFLNIFEHCHRK